MPPPPKGGGTASGTKNGSGAHRGGLESPTSSPTHPAPLSAEALLSSTDLMRQLLSIARGDLSAVSAGGAEQAAVLDAALGNGTGMNAAGAAFPTTSTAEGTFHQGRPSSRAVQPVPVVRTSPHPSPQAASPAPQEAATDAEVSAFYVTALVAQALRMEDYWIDLGHQIEVDQHVEFVQYCAAEGFSSLKVLHLLAWWRQFRALVRDKTAMEPLQLSDGGLLRPHPALSPAEEAAALGRGDSSHASSAGSGPHTRDTASGGSAKSAAKKGRRGSPTGLTAAGDTEANAAAAAGAGAAAPPPSPPPPRVRYNSHDDAVRGELQRFVQWELEHDDEWRRVPREPIVTATPAQLSPRIASAGNNRSAQAAAGANSAAAAAAAANAAGKPSRADKAKLQQQQQQDLELEEQRLARVAALPPENIYLNKTDVAEFVRYLVREDLLSHAALHACVAAHAQRPTSTLTHAAAAPVCFAVQVEVPMAVLPLREAARLSTPGGGVNSGTPSHSPRHSGEHADALHVAPPSPPQLPGPAGAGSTRPTSTASSKGRPRGASKLAAAATDVSAAAAASLTPPPAVSETKAAPLLSAMEALRAEQAKEAAAYREDHTQELSAAAAQKQDEQHAADVNLFFEKPQTSLAVQAVYASMEDTVAARQHRVLLRVAALEQALGLAPLPAAGETAEVAAAGVEGGATAAAAAGSGTAQ